MLYRLARQLNDVYECVIYNAGVFYVNDLNSMVQESLKMSKLSHPNVMKLIGVCIDMGGFPLHCHALHDLWQPAVLPQEAQSRADHCQRRQL